MAETMTEVWHQVHGGLRTFIAKRVANQAEVDDLLQEVFLRVHRRINGLNDPRWMVSWLYQIARNVIMDFAVRRSTNGRFLLASREM